ncbi:SCO family protein [Loktanella sp. R86503]|uniref:SCO family protein n=1 Tax=Loktanella sp. R86503 TaxID=3093847 RepID=UPI0036D92459
MTRNMKRAGIALWAAVLVAFAAVVWLQLAAPDGSDPLNLTDTLGQGDYVLTTTEGETFTAENLKGGATAVFFGFTHCPEVCPTTLGDVSLWQEALAADGQALNVYFVTVDPERDTVDTLRDYVSWVPGVTGVSGTPEQVKAAEAAFRIYARQVPLDDGGYTMDHSASVLLFDDQGRFYEPIGYQEGADRALAKIRRMIES